MPAPLYIVKAFPKLPYRVSTHCIARLETASWTLCIATPNLWRKDGFDFHVEVREEPQYLSEPTP
jgi:hypothetical protein